MKTARAWAPSNIALIKYWGKRDIALNLPAMGSLSVTLSDLRTETEAVFEHEPGPTVVTVDGQAVEGTGLARVEKMLRVIRERTGVSGRAVVSSTTNFPVGAGIASSASGMAAVALAASHAAGWEATREEQSALARLGSGSACRSLYGGFVEWLPGTRGDGWDSHGRVVADAEHWPLDVLVVVVDSGKKKTSSAQGMAQTASTSPFYEPWLRENRGDLDSAREAIQGRDFERLARVAQRSALMMHACMMTGDPMLLYWRGGTIPVLELVENLQSKGTPCFFSMDAGPNVKVFFPPGESHSYRSVFEELPGVEQVLVSGAGPGGGIVE